MAPIGWTKFLYLSYFSKPKCDRAILRTIKSKKITKIVEIGLRSSEFTANMLQTSLRYGGDQKVSYAGVDLFESRPTTQTAFSLKDIHKRLSGDQLRVRLIPGDPMVGLSRFANTLTGTELVVVSSDVDAEAMQQAWFYVPRMLLDNSNVFVCSNSSDSPTATLISREEVEKRAAANRRTAA